MWPKKKKKREKKQTGKRRGKLSKCIIYLSICNKCLLSLSCYAKSLQSCPTLCNPIDSSPPASPCPWDSPGKNTGVGCHFLLQCTKVKSESEVTQSCPTLSDPMDCSLIGSSVHGIFQARVLEWGAIAFSDPYHKVGIIMDPLVSLIQVVNETMHTKFFVAWHID